MKRLNLVLNNVIKVIFFGNNKLREKSRNGFIPVRRLNCYDEVEIVYVKKAEFAN